MNREEPNSQNPKKRKASQISKTNDAYRNLLNTTIKEISHPPTDQDTKPCPSSQSGLSIWTSKEKTAFFNAVESLGKHEICGIAERIGGSKSPLEVREYMSLLEKGVKELKAEINFEEIPIALEISPECCEALDGVVGVLEANQRRIEEKLEMERWGEEWLIDWEGAKILEEKAGSRSRHHGDEELDENGRTTGKSDGLLLKAAELFKPGTFLALSSHLFMNSASPLSNNWQSIIEEKQSLVEGEEEFPSMRATAFTDFHNLTVGLTRRIVSTAIFCAESRLRATSRISAGIKGRLVRQEDVRAALEMLGLVVDMERWWKGVAGRCGVVVLSEGGEVEDENIIAPLKKRRSEDIEEDDDDSDDSNSEGVDDEEEDYEDEILPTVKSRHRHRHRHQGEIGEEEEDDSNSEYEDPNDHDIHSQASHSSSQQLSPNANKTSRLKLSDRSHDDHIEALDTYASQLEESRLWKLLNRDPPSHILLDEAKPKTSKYRPRKNDRELEAWRDRLEYWSQWEVMGLPVKEEEFLEVERRKGIPEEEEEGTAASNRFISGETIDDSDLEGDDEEGVGEMREVSEVQDGRSENMDVESDVPDQ